VLVAGDIRVEIGGEVFEVGRGRKTRSGGGDRWVGGVGSGSCLSLDGRSEEEEREKYEHEIAGKKLHGIFTIVSFSGESQDTSIEPHAARRVK
jgi:hypothetical protein